MSANVTGGYGTLTYSWTRNGAAAALRDAIGAPLPPSEQADYERNLAAAQAGDADTFAAAWSAGGAMALEQTVDYALDR